MQTNMKSVSIIIPIYGVENYIEKCARSIFEQTYTNIDIIFVNDCTPDNSITILKSVLEHYPKQKEKTRILSYPCNKGLSGARKFGLENAHGDYVLQIDSDDYIAPNMVEVMVQKAEKENADIVICDFNYVKDNVITRKSVSPALTSKECMIQVLTGKIEGYVWNKLIKRSLYTSNTIEPIEGLNMCEDMAVIYRLLYFAKKISYVNQALYFYIQRKGSISYGNLTKVKQENIQDLIEHMITFYSENNIKDKTLLDALYMYKANCKSAILINGDTKLLKENLYKGIKLRHYINHPNIEIHQRIIGLFSIFKLQILITLFRKLKDLKNKRK